jgi:hypothetical protein
MAESTAYNRGAAGAAAGTASRKSAGNGWARVALLIMQSEKRQSEHLDKKVQALREDLEPRLRAVELAQEENRGEHREIMGRQDAHRDTLLELKKMMSTIKDALILGRALAWLARLLRGRP